MTFSGKIARRGFDILGIIIKGLAYAGITIMLFMMLFVVADVFLRYVFDRPIFGSIEISESMLVIVAFLSITYCTLEDGNVKMDFFVQRFPLKVQVILEIIGIICCLALIIPMTCVYLPEAIELKKVGHGSTVLGIPTYPFYLIVFISCLLLSLVLLANLVKSVTRLKK